VNHLNAYDFVATSNVTISNRRNFAKKIHLIDINANLRIKSSVVSRTQKTQAEVSPIFRRIHLYPFAGLGQQPSSDRKLRFQDDDCFGRAWIVSRKLWLQLVWTWT